jgi:hypothetical protein
MMTVLLAPTAVAASLNAIFSVNGSEECICTLCMSQGVRPELTCKRKTKVWIKWVRADCERLNITGSNELFSVRRPMSIPTFVCSGRTSNAATPQF